MAHQLFKTAVVTLILMAGSTASAQDFPRPDPLAEPWRDARLRIGPIFFDPTFQIRDLGLDRNVFNDIKGAERRDLTGTLAMTSLAGLQIRKFLFTARQSNSYIWYRTYRSERSVDGALKLTGELRLGVLRPWASWERQQTHARGGFEIDARAGRELPAWEVGSDVQFGWRLGVTGVYRERSTRYAEGEEFDGVALRDVLDHSAEDILGYGRLQLTDFTSAVGGVEFNRLRFDVATLRDVDETYYFGGLESSAESRLGLNIKAGWKTQQRKDPTVPTYSGVVVAASTTFVVGDVMQLSFGVDRQVEFSYDEQYPFYVEQGGEARTIIRFLPQFDLRGDAKLAWLSYSDTLSGTEAPRQDRTMVLGGEFGYYLGGTSGTRVGIRYEYATRVSPVALKNYTRSRVYSQFHLSF